MQRRNLPRQVKFASILFCQLALTAFLFCSPAARAQSPAVDVVQAPLPLGVSGPLPGHTAPQVLDGTAIRVAHYSPELMLRLVLAVKPPHMAEEEKFLKELQDPNSPNFHKFLTAAEWDARFAPSAADEQKVVDWAKSEGLTVTNRFSNRLLVDLEAPAGTIEKAFGVTINNYQVGEELDFANDRDPVLPASLNGVVYAVLGLNSIQRMHGSMPSMKMAKGPDYAPGPVFAEAGSDKADANPQALRAAPNSATRNMTNNFIDPSDIYNSQTYDYAALYALGHCCNPRGVAGGSPPESSIGIAAFGYFNASDLAGFAAKYGLAYNWNAYNIDGNVTCPAGQATCPSDETTLDIEWSTATSNSFGASTNTAHVYVYIAANSLYSTYADMYNYMLHEGYARVFTTSWSCTEYYGCSYAGMDTQHAIFNSMVGQGWTLLAASGDRGSTDDCSHVSVAYPGSDPNFVSVGGTSLIVYSDGTFDSEGAWQGGAGAGSCGSNNGGSGGGVSAYYAQPSWQSGLGGAKRLVPDISLNSGGVSQNYYFNGNLNATGGTSIASPEYAGFFAQENAYLASIGSICGSAGNLPCTPIGAPNFFLYEEGNRNNAAHNPYYDITAGCNSNDITAAGSLTYYCAGPGYDKATGWGSANMLQLAWALNWELLANHTNGVPYVTYSGPAINQWYNSSQTVSWTVHDYSGTTGPTGTGIAGFTQGWDSLAPDPSTEPHGGTGNQFYSGPEFANGTTGCLSQGAGGCGGGSGQGCHTVYVHGWNNEGWTTAGQAAFPESYGPICYDTVAPTIAVANSLQTPASGWFNKPVTVTLSATDPGGSNASGVAQIYYGVNSASCSTANPPSCPTYGGPLVFNVQGTFNLIAFSRDNAGNLSGQAGDTLKIDTAPPATKAGLSGSLLGSYWQTAVTVVLTAADNLSGVQATYYSVDGGAAATYSGSSFSVSAAGSHTLKYWSVDVAGNTEPANTATFAIQSPTTTKLTVSPNPSVNGQAVTLTVTVTAALSGTPSGSVTFLNGATVLGTGVLSGGTTHLATTVLPVGSDSLKVTYAGSTYFLASTSPVVTQVVHVSTATTLTSSLNPAVYGRAVTFTAQVKPSVAGTPSGSVQFFDGGTSLGIAALNASGIGVLATSVLGGGSHSITAVYAGSATYNTSTSSALTEKVTPAGSAAALKASVNPVSYGQAVTFTATVTSSAGTPTGTVIFSAGGKTVATGSLAAGVATYSATALVLGTSAITATYGGSPNYSASASQALSEVTVPAATVTKLASAPNPSAGGQSVFFTATVASATTGTPAGTVTFMDGAVKLGAGTLTAGAATFSTAALAVGSHPITAVYSGSADYKASTSAVVTQTVTAATVLSRVVYVPDYYGKLLQVRVGGGIPVVIAMSLPSCNPNSVAVNSNKTYVVCNSDEGNPDKILVYNAASIRSAAPGALSLAPLKTITSSQFKSLIGIAFDASNNLWVASYGNNQIDEITASALTAATTTVTAPLIDSPSSPVALAFDKNGSLWVTGQFGQGILLNFPSSQFGKGVNATPDYCLATTNLSGCQYVNGVFLGPEGLALFGGNVWVANNSTGATGNKPGRELVGFKYAGGSASAMGTLTLSSTYGNTANAAASPLVCPGGLFAGPVHLWVNDQSYGESNPQCGAAGDVASKTGGVFDFTAAQLAAKPTTASGVLAYPNITGRPGFGGIFVENDQ